MPRSNQHSLFTEIPDAYDLVSFDEAVREKGYALIAGVDEAGRGPLAGPVVASCVVFPTGTVIPGLKDSKALSAAQRENLLEPIQQNAVCFATGIVEAGEIDRINILQAALKAMKIAVSRLTPSPHLLLIDGNMKIDSHLPQIPIVKGDARSQSVAAASIIAKVTRDRIMQTIHERYPLYGFDRNKGYGTKTHLEALKAHGHCPVHRLTFRGVLGPYGPPGEQSGNRMQPLKKM